jgi:hypothetical protein
MLIEKLFGKKQATAGTDNKKSFFNGLIEKSFGKWQKRKSAGTKITNPSKDK